MSDYAQMCPKCRKYIFGTYCFNCNEDIRDMDSKNILPEIFEQFFGEHTNPYNPLDDNLY